MTKTGSERGRSKGIRISTVMHLIAYPLLLATHFIESAALLLVIIPLCILLVAVGTGLWAHAVFREASRKGMI